MVGSFIDEIDGWPLEEWLEKEEEGELEEVGLTVFDPYRGSSDLAELGDGLQTAVESLQEHDRRLVDLECFAAGRALCSGDAAYKLVGAQTALQPTRLRMVALAVVFGLLGMVGVLGTVLTTMSAEMAELQQRTERLEQRVVETHREVRETHHDVDRGLKRLEMAQGL